MNIENIIITGDFLRYEKGLGYSQDLNIHWIGNILSPVFNAIVPQLEIEECTGSSGNLAEDFYHCISLQPKCENWLGIYDSQPSPKQLALVLSRFANSFVVGFELPPVFCRALSQLGIPYVDLVMHPVRFLDDLIFGLASNIPGLQEAVSAWAISDEQIRIEGGLVRAKICRMPQLEICKLADDIAIFACQTPIDRVLINGSKLHKIEEHTEQLKDIFDRHELVLVKPHPQFPNSRLAGYLTQFSGNTRITQSNFYQLICQPTVSAVYSLCSSTSIEAEYLGKTGCHLVKYPYTFSASGLSETVFMAVRDALVDISFWQNILKKAGLEPRYPNVKKINLNLRRNLNIWWGADILYK